jgi:hypothetical protein
LIRKRRGVIKRTVAARNGGIPSLEIKAFSRKTGELGSDQRSCWYGRTLVPGAKACLSVDYQPHHHSLRNLMLSFLRFWFRSRQSTLAPAVLSSDVS